MGNAPYKANHLEIASISSPNSSVKGSEKDGVDTLCCLQVVGNLHNLVVYTRI